MLRTYERAPTLYQEGTGLARLAPVSHKSCESRRLLFSVIYLLAVMSPLALHHMLLAKIVFVRCREVLFLPYTAPRLGVYKATWT